MLIDACDSNSAIKKFLSKLCYQQVIGVGYFVLDICDSLNIDKRKRSLRVFILERLISECIGFLYFFVDVIIRLRLMTCN